MDATHVASALVGVLSFAVAALGVCAVSTYLCLAVIRSYLDNGGEE